jgi:hypothetical protein
MRKRIDTVELIITILPILFICVISIWHAFGKNGMQPWKAIYFLSNHFLIIYLAFLVYFSVGFTLLRNIMIYLVIPYFSFKIVYQLLIWCKIPLGTSEAWVYIWGMISVFVLLIGALMLWNRLKKIG